MLFPFVIYDLESGVDLCPISGLVYKGTSVKKRRKHTQWVTWIG